MRAIRSVSRVADMHPSRALRVVQDSDGDVRVYIVQDGFPIGDVDTGDERIRSASLEFCTSGGRSRNTHRALVALMEAMALDHQEHPIP